MNDLAIGRGKRGLCHLVTLRCYIEPGLRDRRRAYQDLASITDAKPEDVMPLAIGQLDRHRGPTVDAPAVAVGRIV